MLSILLFSRVSNQQRKRAGLGDSQEDQHGMDGAGEGLLRPQAMTELLAIMGKTERAPRRTRS